MHFAHAADVIVGVGGGTINDICKILAGLTGRPYLIVGTAPSMDGFASDTSSMVVDGLKSSLPTAGARAILGDTDILAAAPGELLAAGLGDMLAKYISLAEWRISAEVNGEYFCPHVANLVRRSLDKCAAAAEGLSRRDPDAVGCVMEGLVLSGLAMGFAGVTRPASGMEHYFSHIWDMRALAFDRPEHLQRRNRWAWPRCSASRSMKSCVPSARARKPHWPRYRCFDGRIGARVCARF